MGCPCNYCTDIQKSNCTGCEDYYFWEKRERDSKKINVNFALAVLEQMSRNIQNGEKRKSVDL